MEFGTRGKRASRLYIAAQSFKSPKSCGKNSPQTNAYALLIEFLKKIDIFDLKLYTVVAMGSSFFRRWEISRGVEYSTSPNIRIFFNKMTFQKYITIIALHGKEKRFDARHEYNKIKKIINFWTFSRLCGENDAPTTYLHIDRSFKLHGSMEFWTRGKRASRLYIASPSLKSPKSCLKNSP